MSNLTKSALVIFTFLLTTFSVQAQLPKYINFGAQQTCGDFATAIKTTGNIAPADSIIVSGTDVRRYAPVRTVSGASGMNCVYSNELYGGVDSDLMLSFCDLSAFQEVTLTLHFAEIYYGVTGAGKRMFNIEINGVTVETNFDIWATANDISGGTGGHDIAVDRTFNATADSGGCIIINLIDTGFGDPKIGGITMLDGHSNLPVEFLSFQAKEAGKGAVNLSWETAMELNNAGFEIQYSSDAINYESAGFVEGVGTTDEVQAYNFQIDDLRQGTYTFRLKQIDYDGKFDYSSRVEFTVNLDDVSNIFPNPASSIAKVLIAVEDRQQVSVDVFNLAGQQISREFEGTLNAGADNQIEIKAASLTPGTYLVKITGETFSQTQKLLIVR